MRRALERTTFPLPWERARDGKMEGWRDGGREGKGKRNDYTHHEFQED
jgi:hypothetical protein